ncbi:MAG TPA: ubiquinol-cytochrome c reductase cytochrome b subunit [Streptosporangiaceae bacterium]|nr:ubiquinol-cytochrome c reductase cytochrome b subunit [Streptosporangiaceae bacterium]
MKGNTGRNVASAIDNRFGAAAPLRSSLRKIFPDHWSFLLGEMALYSFVVLVLTGTFLTFFFKPSMTDVVYRGSYLKLDGVHMSEAFRSTLDISFDVRGGLLMRQIHHWAALLFLAAISIHVMRIFFTGAFRKPRELNWLIGVAMFALATFEGFAGYSLPDDLLSGTGLRIAQGIVMSIPIVGTYLSFFFFGGQYPSELVIPRLFILHVLLVPGLLIALIGAHLFSVWHQGHTQWPGRHERERNEVGEPMWPVFLAKTSALFCFTFGALALASGIFQINPVWLPGPYSPAVVSATSQPDWYVGFMEGALRLMPAVQTQGLGHTVAWNVFIPGVVIPVGFFLLLGAYPFAERLVTGDRRYHRILDRPRNDPIRTALGAAAIAMAIDLLLAGGDDVISLHLNIPIEFLVWALRIGFFVAPLVAFVITRYVCLALQQRDQRQPPDVAELRASRPVGLIAPLPRHVIPLPTPRRAAAQVRSRLNRLYVSYRLETKGTGDADGQVSQPEDARQLARVPDEHHAEDDR